MEPKDNSEPRCPRLGPGEDPTKRAQIVSGAGRVFSRTGFDAASVSDIAREAGVSKGTIYVYFRDKEDLFETMIDEARGRMFLEYEAVLEGPGDIRDRLVRYGRALARTLCADHVIRAHRVIIGVTERMPELGKRFYERGADRGARLLARYLDPEVATGRLEIADTHLAATQFLALATAGLFKPRLLGARKQPPSEAEIARNVDAAVAMFLCRYAGAEGRE